MRLFCGEQEHQKLACSQQGKSVCQMPFIQSHGEILFMQHVQHLCAKHRYAYLREPLPGSQEPRWPCSTPCSRFFGLLQVTDDR